MLLTSQYLILLRRIDLKQLNRFKLNENETWNKENHKHLNERYYRLTTQELTLLLESVLLETNEMLDEKRITFWRRHTLFWQTLSLGQRIKLKMYNRQTRGQLRSKCSWHRIVGRLTVSKNRWLTICHLTLRFVCF